jgi:very-short-patch-repair endonuclease
LRALDAHKCTLSVARAKMIAFPGKGKMHVLRTVYQRADRRLGLITRAELHACGLSDSAIRHVVATGALVRVYRGVYRVPGSANSLEQRALAACLACGPGAVAAERLAADLWPLVERPSGLTVVSIPRGRSARHQGIVVRRPLELPKSDVTRLGKIPITRVARTIRDLPRVLKEEALDTAIRDRRITPHVFVEDPGLLGKLAKDRLGLGVPHWRIERKAVGILRRFGLPAPIRQHRVRIGVRNYRIDLAYPDRRIAIELKGEAPHWGADRFQYDIERSNALGLDGWDEYTFTWLQVTQRQADVAAMVRKALEPRARR